MANSDFIPDGQFVPDAKPQTVSAQQPTSQPHAGPDFIPEDQFTSDEEHYGTAPQMLGTAAESFANTLGFGLARPVENLISKQFNIPELSSEAQEQRAKTNIGSGIAGGIAGFATGIGAAGAIGTAGRLASAGIESRVIANAVKYGLEGALLQTGNETGKLISDGLGSDPNQALGSAAINVGLAGLIGGGIGAATGGVGSLWNAKFGPKVGSALDSAGEALTSEAPPTTGFENLGQQKENAEELKAAGRVLGINELPLGTTFENDLERNAAANLKERPSFSGVKLGKQYADTAKKVGQALDSTLDDAYPTNVSKGDAGKIIRGKLHDILVEEYKPIQAGYEALEPELQKATVSDGLQQHAIDQIAAHPDVVADPETNLPLVNKLTKQIQGIEDVSQLKKIRTNISNQANDEFDAIKGQFSTKGKILLTAKNALTDIRGAALDEAAENGLISPKSRADIELLDARNAGIQNTAKQIGIEGGLGKKSSASGLIDRLAPGADSTISDESFVDRILNVKDRNTLSFFEKNAPEALEAARRFKLQEIGKNAIDYTPGAGEKLSASKFLSQVRSLGNEAKEVIFKPGDQRLIDAAEKLHAHIPGLYNGSRTSYADAFAKFLSPAGLVQNLTDAGQYLWLKSIPHLNEAAELAGGDEAAKLGAIKFAQNADKGSNPTAFKSLVDYIRATIKGQSSLNNGVKNLFDATKAVLPEHLIPDQKSRDKLEKAINTVSIPENAQKVGSGIGTYLPGHGSAVAALSAQATNYLNSLKPTQTKAGPLDAAPPVGKGAQAKYNRALDVAEQPLMVLKYAKEGTLQAQDMLTLHTLYPSIHSKINQLVTNELVKNPKIPYAQRVSMNLLMGGAPLDGTMSPMAMHAIMGSASPQSLQQAAEHKSGGKTSQSTLSQINKVNALYQTPLQSRGTQKRA